MSTTRRNFIKASATAAGALSFGTMSTVMASSNSGEAGKSMNLLILGGTGFIGPHMVEYALKRGHQVSVFNRGKSEDTLPANVERLVGDRDTKIGDGLNALKGRQWDAVIDNTGYVPRHVRDSADLLKGNVGRYFFTSTGSVYDMSQESLDENSPMTEVIDPDEENWYSEHYGGLKVLCEQAVQERYGDQSTIVRPHMVAGPGDHTDRYTYWIARIDHGGDVIAPGDPDSPSQYIDVKDLSEFSVNLVEADQPGVFNGAGPTYSELPFAGLLYAIRGVTSADVRFTWIDEEFLLERQANFQMWLPKAMAQYRGANRVSIERSVAHGLTLRPLAATAHDTLEWWKAQSQERRDKLPLNLERDAEILEAWRAKNS
jgi:2'-hydroxyisoflavone reductase